MRKCSDTTPFGRLEAFQTVDYQRFIIYNLFFTFFALKTRKKHIF